jgi:hypothetical protein
MTIPKRPGERDMQILALARGLKYNAGLAERSWGELKPIVRRWHEGALPVIRTKDFTETWTAFIRAWPRARTPLGMDVLTEAFKRSLIDPLPAAASDYDSEPVRRLVGLCAALASLSPGSRFFLSTHTAAKLLNTHAMQVSRWMKMLAADGFIKVTQAGNEHRATRFQWIAPKEGGKP